MWKYWFTYLPLVPHIYASVNRVSIVSDNGLLPIRHQAILWTNAGVLSIGPIRTNFSEILIKIKIFIHKNASENIVCEMVAILSRGNWINMLTPDVKPSPKQILLKTFWTTKNKLKEM